MSETTDTRYGTLTDAELADAYGVAKGQAKAEAHRLEALDAELVKRGKAQYLGRLHTVVKVVGQQNRFDTAAVKAEFGAAWYDARRKAVPIQTWAVSASDAATRILAEIGTPAEPLRKRRRGAI